MKTTVKLEVEVEFHYDGVVDHSEFLDRATKLIDVQPKRIIYWDNVGTTVEYGITECKPKDAKCKQK